MSETFPRNTAATVRKRRPTPSSGTSAWFFEVERDDGVFREGCEGGHGVEETDKPDQIDGAFWADFWEPDDDGNPSAKEGGANIVLLDSPSMITPVLRISVVQRLAILSIVLFYLAAVAFLVVGFVLRSSFHNGAECDMTYSRQRFLPLSFPNTTTTTAGSGHYRLLKFVDVRDPRHWHLYDTNTGHGVDSSRILTMEDNFCLLPTNGTHRPEWTMAPIPNRGHAVLYVPGHRGSYRQAGSIGAHGLGLTRAWYSDDSVTDSLLNGLKDGTVNGTGEAADERKFVFDVFAADFDEEGTGLHGGRIARQAEFVGRAVRLIAEACQSSTVTIVAHSLGGIVARSAFRLDPSARPFVRDIITLATPHVALPYTFDHTVAYLYHKINERQEAPVNDRNDDGPMVVSISGGLRDEQIPPEMCNSEIVESVMNGVSVLVTDMLPPHRDVPTGNETTTPALGVDHNAIVWCHHVLRVVREVVHTVARFERRAVDGSPGADDATRRRKIVVQKMLYRKRKDKSGVATSFEGRGYDWAMDRLDDSFMKSHSFWSAQALKTAMLYNVEPFVALYVVVALLHNMLASFTHLHQQVTTSTCSAWNGASFWRRLGLSAVIPLSVCLMGSYWSLSEPHRLHPISMLCLAVISDLLYRLIAHAVLPGFARVICFISCRRKRLQTNNSSMHSNTRDINRPRMNKVMRVMLLAFAIMLCSAPFVGSKPISSMLFLWTIFVILLLTVSLLALRPTMPKTVVASTSWEQHDGERSFDVSLLLLARYLIRRRHDSLALLLPTLPLLLAGKVAHSFFLLSAGGDEKMDDVYAAFRGGDSRVADSAIWWRWRHDDLCNSVALLCIPVGMQLYLLRHKMVRCRYALGVLASRDNEKRSLLEQKGNGTIDVELHSGVRRSETRRLGDRSTASAVGFAALCLQACSLGLWGTGAFCFGAGYRVGYLVVSFALLQSVEIMFY